MAQAQLSQENVIFQQYTNQKGETEFRTRFGRQKAMVFRKHLETGYYYVDMYDNKPGKTKFNGMTFGMDELDWIVGMRGNLNSLMTCFPQQPSNTPHYMGAQMKQQLPITPPAGSSKSDYMQFKMQEQSTQSLRGKYLSYSPQTLSQHSTPYFIAERDQSLGMNLKRPSSRDIYPEAPKKAKVATYDGNENTDEQCENIPPEILNEFFCSPLN